MPQLWHCRYSSRPGTASAQVSDPGNLSVWVGHWTYHAIDLQTQYSTADTYDGTGDCSWSTNHAFVICDYLTKNAPAGFPKNDIVVFTYNPENKEYSHVGVFMERAPFAQHMTFDGKTWITSAEIPYKGKTAIYRTVYDFQSKGKRNATTEISADNGKAWTTVTTFTSTQSTR